MMATWAFNELSEIIVMLDLMQGSLRDFLFLSWKKKIPNLNKY